MILFQMYYFHMSSAYNLGYNQTFPHGLQRIIFSFRRSNTP